MAAAVVRVALDLGDDAVHHPHRLDRVAAGGRTRPTASPRRRPRRPRSPRPRPRRGSASAPRSCSPASASRRSPACRRRRQARRMRRWMVGTCSGGISTPRSPRATITASERADDLVQPLDRRRLLELGHDASPAGDELADLVQVLRPLDERQRHPVDPELEREGEVGPVLLGQRRDRQYRARRRSRPCGRTACPPTDHARVGEVRRRPSSTSSRTLPSSSSSCTPGASAANTSGCGSGTRSGSPGVAVEVEADTRRPRPASSGRRRSVPTRSFGPCRSARIADRPAGLAARRAG